MEEFSRARIGLHVASMIAFCLFMSICGNCFAQERPMKISNPLQGSGIVALDASSPEFMPEVQKLLTPAAISKAAPFLTRSIVLINNTNEFIWGFTVVYQYPDWISPAGTPWKHRISPSCGGPADRNRMLAPGARFLVTPVSDFLASATRDGGMILQPFLDEGMDRMINQFKAQHPDANERVEATIDSVIFEDGVLEGPDSEGMMARTNERVRAEKDLAVSLSGLRGDALRARLLLDSHRGMRDEYSGRTSTVAQSLIAVLDQRGENATVDVVEKIRNTHWFQNADHVRRK